jgi:hypothetical protein
LPVPIVPANGTGTPNSHLKQNLSSNQAKLLPGAIKAYVMILAGKATNEQQATIPEGKRLAQTL